MRSSGQVIVSSYDSLTSWSTASLPTRASPTNSTRSGMLTAMSLARAVIRGALSCILPAVSTSTTSNAWLRAKGTKRSSLTCNQGSSGCRVGVRSSGSLGGEGLYRKRWPPWRSRLHPSRSPSRTAERRAVLRASPAGAERSGGADECAAAPPPPHERCRRRRSAR